MDPHKYLIKGVYETVKADTIRVTELPVGTWTDDYKQFLEGLMDHGGDKSGKKTKKVVLVREYTDMSTDKTVDITIRLLRGKKEELEKQVTTYGEEALYNGLEKTLKLITTNMNTNMHVFDHEEKLRKYDRVNDIIDDFVDQSCPILRPNDCSAKCGRLCGASLRQYTR